MISRTNGSSIRKKKEGKEKELRNNSNIDLYIGVQLLIINETTGEGENNNNALDRLRTIGEDVEHEAIDYRFVLLVLESKCNSWCLGCIRGIIRVVI